MLQPELQFYWHRPLHELMGYMFAAGFFVDGFEEPAGAPPEPDAAAPFGSQQEALQLLMWVPGRHESIAQSARVTSRKLGASTA